MPAKQETALREKHAWLSEKVRLLEAYLPHSWSVIGLATEEYNQAIHELKEVKTEQRNRSSMAAGSET